MNSKLNQPQNQSASIPNGVRREEGITEVLKCQIVSDAAQTASLMDVTHMVLWPCMS